MEVSSIDKKTNPPAREGRRRLTRAEKKRKRAEIVQQRAKEKLEMCERIKTILVILLRITKKVSQGINQIRSIMNWLLSGRVNNVSWMDISENDFKSSDLTEMFTARFSNGNVSLMKRRLTLHVGENQLERKFARFCVIYCRRNTPLSTTSYGS